MLGWRVILNSLTSAAAGRTPGDSNEADAATSARTRLKRFMVTPRVRRPRRHRHPWRTLSSHAFTITTPTRRGNKGRKPCATLAGIGSRGGDDPWGGKHANHSSDPGGCRHGRSVGFAGSGADREAGHREALRPQLRGRGGGRHFAL